MGAALTRCGCGRKRATVAFESAKPPAPASKDSLESDVSGGPGSDGTDAALEQRSFKGLQRLRGRAAGKILRERELQQDAATRIQSTFRRHLIAPGPISLTSAANRAWKALPRDIYGRVFSLVSFSLIPLAAVEGVGTVLVLRFELEFGIIFAILFALNIKALMLNMAGGAITSGRIELPFPGAVGSLGNATILNNAHGMYDAIGSVFLALVTIILRRVYTQFRLRVDQDLVTAADYTVEIRGLPATTTATELSTWLRENFFGVQLIGTTVVMDERKQLATMNRLDAVRRRLRNTTRDVVLHQNKRVLRRRDALLVREHQLLQELREEIAKAQRCTGVAFAVFNRMNDALQVTEEIRHIRYIDGRHVRGRRAPEPSDVIWEDLHMSAPERSSRKLTGMLMSIGVTLIASVVMVVLRCARRAPRASAAAAVPRSGGGAASGTAPACVCARPRSSAVLPSTRMRALPRARARFIKPIWGSGDHWTFVRVVSPVCIVTGNVLINVCVPYFVAHEGWQDRTRRNNAMCLQLGIYQVLNSLAGALLLFWDEDFLLNAAWYDAACSMVSEIVMFTIVVSDVLSLLRPLALVRRLILAPFARSQAEANALWHAEDPLYMPARLSLVLKYLVLALIFAPFSPTVYALASAGARARSLPGRVASPRTLTVAARCRHARAPAATALAGCLLSYAVDKINLLRQLPPLPKTSSRLVLSMVLGQLLPLAVVLHTIVAVCAYVWRAHQLAKWHHGEEESSCGFVSPHVSTSTHRFGAYVKAAIDFISAEEVHVLASCNHSVMWMSASVCAVLVITVLGRTVRPDGLADQAPLLVQGGYNALESGSTQPLWVAAEGLKLYISALQQKLLTDAMTQSLGGPSSFRRAGSALPPRAGPPPGAAGGTALASAGGAAGGTAAAPSRAGETSFKVGGSSAADADANNDEVRRDIPGVAFSLELTTWSHP